MMLFLFAWSLFGVAVWIDMRRTLQKTKLFKPGLFELIILVILGPIPFILNFFEKK